MEKIELVIIGGGVAGISSAIGAKKSGIEDIIILEREERLGGIANQCIHDGFGGKVLGKAVTSPEYVEYLKSTADSLNIEYKLNTMVLDVTNDNIITYVNPDEGMKKIQANNIIIATGSSEKYTGRIKIVNNRTTGIYTVGTAQQFVNVHGYLPGKEIVIVGLNEVSLIIARRLIIEGAKIKAIVEERDKDDIGNIRIGEIIDIFNIPVEYSSTVDEFFGKERVESVALLSSNGKRKEIKCDCLLISAEWIPETDIIKNTCIEINDNGSIKVNNLMKTSRDNIFACGNVVHCYCHTDDITIEGIKTGENVHSIKSTS